MRKIENFKEFNVFYYDMKVILLYFIKRFLSINLNKTESVSFERIFVYGI